jgi:hypothetical protein
VRGAVLLLLGIGCETEVQQPTVHTLTLTESTALLNVTLEVGKLIADKQPTGTNNKSPMDIPIDEDFTCASGGTGHMMGVGHYIPITHKGYGPTTFEVTVSLDDCAFDSAPVTAESLFVRGPLRAGDEASNLTYRGEVTWPPATDTCAITLKLYGQFLTNFDGTVCSGHFTPETIDSLPP